ncbi:Beta-cyclopiazonate dehydrogenase [Paramyrothecium foliicola]|nr:Beta-cyclopiazonate dehydrogenase [Paramyrothecium foliicola]
MRSSLTSLGRVLAVSSLVLAVESTSPVPVDDPSTLETITRDVCIIGGGSSGTYAAVRLQDQGKSVVVVEQSDHLGGHAETLYLDNGKHIEYGVMGVFNDELSRNYFHRLGAAYKPLIPGALKADYVDFKTGRKLPAGSSNVGGLGAVIKYSALIEKYDYLREGVYNLPDPIPEELLQLFGDFVEKHALHDALETIFTFASSVGDILETPLLYVVQSFGSAHVNALLQGYITPTQGFSKLYASAAAIIGPENVLYNNTVLDSTRSDADGVTLTVVNQSNGKKLRIQAQKLLVTMPPTAEAMAPFDLNATEMDILRKWKWQTYYASVVNDTGIPDGSDVTNFDPNQPHHLPKPPFQWALQWMGASGYQASKLVGDAAFTARDAQDLILSDLLRMKDTYPGGAEDPRIVAFMDHTPTSLTVPVEDIRSRFYDKLYALQSYRSTFYTGRSFCSDYSSLLWAYTDTILRQMFP